MEDILYYGQWWFPNEPDKKINGVFSFTGSEGGELKLDGNLGYEETKTILGVNREGQEVTLSNCFSTSSENSNFRVNEAYVGCHFYEKITFSDVYKFQFIRLLGTFKWHIGEI